MESSNYESITDGQGTKYVLDTDEKKTDCVISPYGAFQAVDALPKLYIREVFSHTPDEQLLDLADMIQENIDDFDTEPEEIEEEIKSLAFKRAILIDMAYQD